MLETIILHANYTDSLSYYDDWMDAFCQNPLFKTKIINTVDLRTAKNNAILTTLEQCPFIIIHHSVTSDTLKYIKPFENVLKNRKGKLLVFVGNEVNLPNLGMAEKISFLKEIAPNFIATQLLLEAGEWLYSECQYSKVIAMPHALNPNAFYSNTRYQSRKWDIGTRSAKYGVYIGDNDRNHIIEYFANIARQKKLEVDLGLGDVPQRYNRENWRAFLNSCKATISTEAGSFYLEKNDSTVKEITAFLKSKTDKFILPKEGFLRETYRTVVPQSLRTWIKKMLQDKMIEIDVLEHDFNSIYYEFFEHRKQCPVYSKAISSRHFDAAGTKTLQIMFAGRYNDILVKNEHYLALEKDFSNIEEILSILFDEKSHTRIVDALYEHVMQNHTYEHRIQSLLKYL